MTDYTHAIGGIQDEKLDGILDKITRDDDTVVSETAAENAEGTDVDADAFRNLCRTNPNDVLVNTDLDQLKGGDQKLIRELRTEDDGCLVQLKVQVDYVSETFGLPKQITFACPPSVLG